MNSARPLHGLRVLDFTIFMAGPYCTRVLADLGADVIKVEPPEGDQIRVRPPLRHGHSGYFAHLNCGKRSIALDLKKPEVTDAIHRMAESVDVIVENFRPGVMKRLRLDYGTLAKINPRLIYCAISGFGQTGPAADRPAYAPIIHAASGYDYANMTYQIDPQRPGRTGIFIADALGGLYAVSAIQAALLARARTGKGQFIDVSLMESMMSMMVYEFQEAQFPAENYRRPVYTPVRTRDGFIIVAPTSQNNFEALADVVGHPEWKTDARFAHVRAREKNWDDLNALIESWSAIQTTAACIDILNAAGIPNSRYRRIGENLSDPQLIEREAFAGIDDGGGPLLVFNQPFRMSDAETGAGSSVPALGENTDEVLTELARMSREEIDQLRAAGGSRT
jgi:crotonobetainyl-CoA:carnitine CoA-transferase CaiB-like acyl-CoA transferase